MNCKSFTTIKEKDIELKILLGNLIKTNNQNK